MKSHVWQFDAYGKPSQQLHWREQQLPEPGPGQVLLKIRAIGLNSSDQRSVEGNYFPTNQFPSCVGTEAVGEVVALGAEGDTSLVNGLELSVGARVATLSAPIDRQNMGVCRDYGLYDQTGLAPVPENYSDQEAAALWVGVLTMAGAMQMGGLNAENALGKQVLVTAGASGMGVVALKLAKCWGANTIATTRNADKVAQLEAVADQVVVCDDSKSLAQGVLAATYNAGVDLVLDPVGAAFYPGLLESCANGGHIVSYEAITGSESNLSVFDMMLKGVSIHGYTIFRPFQNPDLLNALIRIGMDNADALRPVIAGTFELSELPQALEQLARSEHIGKLVVTV